MFILNWFLARSIRFRIFTILGFILIPVCLLVQFFILPTFKDKIMEGKKFNTQHAVDLSVGVIKKICSDSSKVNANQAVQIQSEANDMAKISNELREIIEGKIA